MTFPTLCSTMKTAVAFLALAAGTNAFAPASTSARTSTDLKAAELDSLIGVGPETGGKIFDPCGLNKYLPADWARRAELSNGRSAMLANVGWFFPKLVGTFDSDDVTTTDPIEAILQADPQWWAQFLLICGVAEFYKYKQEQAGKSFTGDGPAAVDYAQMWDTLDDKAKEDMRMKELKNGRLAMIGFASYLAAYFIPGSVPLL